METVRPTDIPPAGRMGEGALRLFAAREGEILKRLASLSTRQGNRALQLLDHEGGIVWSSSNEPSPIMCMSDVPLSSLPGRLRIVRYGYEGEANEGLWLRVAGLLLDSIAGRSQEMSGLIDEHIALTDQLLAVYNIARGTRAHWDLEEQLGVVLREAVRVTAMDAGLLWVSGPSVNRLLVHPPDQALSGLGPSLADMNEPTDPSAILALPGIAGRFRASATASLAAGQDRSGRILLLSADANRQVLARDTKLAAAMADLAGTFIETASLQQVAVQSLQMAKELEIARAIQHLLIPEMLDASQQHEVAAFYRPAREVGGDFYLSQPLPDGRLLLALGDVAGKGVPAALLMSMTRTAVLSLAEGASSPATILRRIGRILYEDLDRTGKFVTLLLAIYDPAGADLLVANAGHSPVYIAQEKGPFRSLEPTAPPLGVLADSPVMDQSYVFGTGDLLVATSDGFSEARNPAGELLGTPRLAAILEASREGHARAVLDRIVGAVSAYVAGAPQSDDETAIILRGRSGAT